MSRASESRTGNVGAESSTAEDKTLDPMDSEKFRTQTHRMLDDMLDYTEHIREQPVWQPIQDEGRRRFRDALPRLPADLATVHEEFMRVILPFAAGNVHPGFMGWVQGGGTPGFHGGEHFLRVENLDELPAALAKLPGRELNVIQYLDARTADGKTRKYRVRMIDGKLNRLHAAISSHWKIHYLNADMEDYPEHRAEDARLLGDMSGVLGPHAVAALEEIQKSFVLDYGGIDFGLCAKGEVLLFEANATMAVIPPDEDQRWNYRRPAVEQINRAALKMLLARAKAGSPEKRQRAAT
jgi:hypothetical protein